MGDSEGGLVCLMAADWRHPAWGRIEPWKAFTTSRFHGWPTENSAVALYIAAGNDSTNRNYAESVPSRLNIIRMTGILTATGRSMDELNFTLLTFDETHCQLSINGST